MIIIKGQPVMLGKLPAKLDTRTLHAAKYFKQVSPPPATVDNMTSVPVWNKYLNNQIGDCTIAGAMHDMGLWTYNALGIEAMFSDADVLSAYSAVSGYDPKSGANDNGANMLDVLKLWRTTGIGNHKIVAFVQLDVNDLDQIKQAIAMFGAIYSGFEVPQSAIDQINAFVPWTVSPTRNNIVGGHAIGMGQYDANQVRCATWGQLQWMSWEFFGKYFSEVYAVVTQDWLSSNGKDPRHQLDINALLADLAAIGNKQPTPDPVPTPVPTPIPQPWWANLKGCFK